MRAKDFLGERRERGNRRHREVGAEGEALRDAAADANAGERPRSRPERDAVELRAAPIRPPRGRREPSAARAPSAPARHARPAGANACRRRRPRCTTRSRYRAPGFASAEFYSTGDGRAADAARRRLQSRRAFRHVRPRLPSSFDCLRSADDRADRLARPGRARHRPDRRQGGIRRGRSAGRNRRDHDPEEEADVRRRARRRGAEVQCRPGHAPLPSLRHLRRLLAPALRRRRAGRGQAAHARGRAVAPGRVRPALLLPPIHGPAWEYRHRARLSVRHVVKKGGMLIGFHERKSSYVADMNSCAVLPRKISDLLPALRLLIGGLSVRDRLPQIELAVGDGENAAHVLVLRILAPLSPEDEAALASFADAHGVQFYLQPGGPGTAAPLRPSQPPLAYVLPEFDLRFPYSPTEFTQVNPAINRVLVRRAMMLLDPRPGERIADFFCGIGNFTLPIARRGAAAIGVEGSAALVARAAENAAANGLAANAQFRRRQSVRGHAGKRRSAGTARQDPRSIRRAKARSSSSRRCPAMVRPTGSSTCRATRRRSRAMRRCSCTTTATTWRRRASSTCSRTRRTSSRSRSSRADRRGASPRSSAPKTIGATCVAPMTVQSALRGVSRAAPRTSAAG